MGVRPNFADDAQLTDGSVRVEGQSPEDSDILDIRVALVQGDQVSERRSRQAGLGVACHPPRPDGPDASSVDFQPGLAVAFGVETHRENLMTITWAEPMTIRTRPRS